MSVTTKMSAVDATTMLLQTQNEAINGHNKRQYEEGKDCTSRLY
jgi:hypothetical protein